MQVEEEVHTPTHSQVLNAAVREAFTPTVLNGINSHVEGKTFRCLHLYLRHQHIKDHFILQFIIKLKDEVIL